MKPPEPTDPTTTDPFERMLLNAGRADAPRATQSVESLHTMESAHTGRPPASRDVPTIPAADGNVLKPGVWIDNFKILRLVGQGAMGAVYLARDKRLGRKVALKVVLPHLLGSRTNLARLGIEAQLTAKLNHPHVVTVYAVGRVGKGLYVALEYLEGQSLRSRIEQGVVSIPDVIRYGTNIAEALAAAHEKGVLHRDLKPENVMLPNDGRLRVVDFGLARHFDLDFEPEDPARSAAPASIGSLIDQEISESILSSHGDGTPAYMAPEQWHSETNSTTTDIWALGVLLYEMAVGEHPFPCQTMETLYYAVCVDEPPVLPPSIPGGLRDLIGVCLSQSPSDRPTASEVAEKLKELNRTDTDAQPITENPFRGLTPFAERHSQLFFGRDEELAQFRERLRHAPVLPIVGASGVGKTSFVLAGICPRLAREKEWRIVHVRPGAQPFQALAWRLYHATQPQLRDSFDTLDPERASRGSTADTLRVLGGAPSSHSTTQDAEEAASPVTNSSALDTRAVDDAVQFVDRLAKALRAERHCLSLTLREMAETANTKVLLVVDQLEELFTLCEQPEDRERFVEALCVAADDRADPIRIIFTVRDDYLSRLTTSSVVQQALRTVTVLRKPDAAMLEEVLRGPVEL
ncbi:MAG: serine/threonine-protein kinase, partial [Polyangiaceae bacterium]